MAKITLDKLRHSYMPAPSQPSDYALKEIDLSWRDGGAYALLGPSGCGKSTLLNIISGLLTPSDGRVLFDGEDVTNLPPDQRNIAQVFQFPVIYDTIEAAVAAAPETAVYDVAVPGNVITDVLPLLPERSSVLIQ